MHARLPNNSFTRNAWINLCVDMNSIFALCFTGHNFRSLDSIYISGTLKIRKIMSLHLPAGDLLPLIGEYTKYPVILQEIDSGSFPQSWPLYYSSSPAKVNQKHYYKPRKNIFESDSSSNLKQFKKEYMISANLGAKSLFRSPKRKETLDKEVRRKITHNHSKNMLAFKEEIEEDIESVEEQEEKPWIELLSLKNTNVFEKPDYFQAKISNLCQVRHFTPPFVHLKDNVKYDPIERCYDNLK